MAWRWRTFLWDFTYLCWNLTTILLERTIEQQGLWERLSAEDFRALTALFHGHINPYRPDHARSGAVLVSETGLMAPTTALKKWLNASPGC
jgi:hypothetical protein